MISYELAKKLKDAGFGVGNTAENPCYHWFDEDGKFHTGMPPETGWTHCPTLSELIKACGDHFANMIRTSEGKWSCRFRGFYDSPEEAVARQWFDLQKCSVSK